MLNKMGIFFVSLIITFLVLPGSVFAGLDLLVTEEQHDEGGITVYNYYEAVTNFSGESWINSNLYVYNPQFRERSGTYGRFNITIQDKQEPSNTLTNIAQFRPRVTSDMDTDTQHHKARLTQPTTSESTYGEFEDFRLHSDNLTVYSWEGFQQDYLGAEWQFMVCGDNDKIYFKLLDYDTDSAGEFTYVDKSEHYFCIADEMDMVRSAKSDEIDDMEQPELSIVSSYITEEDDEYNLYGGHTDELESENMIGSGREYKEGEDITAEQTIDLEGIDKLEYHDSLNYILDEPGAKVGRTVSADHEDIEHFNVEYSLGDNWYEESGWFYDTGEEYSWDVSDIDEEVTFTMIYYGEGHESLDVIYQFWAEEASAAYRDLEDGAEIDGGGFHRDNFEEYEDDYIEDYTLDVQNVDNVEMMMGYNVKVGDIEEKVGYTITTPVKDIDKETYAGEEWEGYWWDEVNTYNFDVSDRESLQVNVWARYDGHEGGDLSYAFYKEESEPSYEADLDDELKPPDEEMTWIQRIAHYLRMPFDYIGHLVDTLDDGVSSAIEGISTIYDDVFRPVIGFLPSEVISIMLMGVTISVVLRIFGR